MLRTLVAPLNRYFFAPAPLRVCAIFRVFYAFLLLINIIFWAPDLSMWFSNKGLGSYETTVQLNHSHTLSVFYFLPNTTTFIWVCYGLFVVQTVALLVGWLTRLQAICVYVWLLSFYSLNALIWDGQDILCAMLGFFLMFLPSEYFYSIDSRRKKLKGSPPAIWPIRLIQIEMCLIYLSTTLAKAAGETWIDGSAMYYVVRLHDMTGRLPFPSFVAESLPLLEILSWTVLVVEGVLPLLLIVPKTRKAGIILALLLHLGIEVTMDLFLFQWLMICGLISFLSDHRQSDSSVLPESGKLGGGADDPQSC